MLSTVIFDMDGVIIDSEPLWHESEIEVFHRYGVPLTKAHCIETQGIRIDEVVEYWYGRHPWQHPSKEKVAEFIVDGLIERIHERGELINGVMFALNLSRSLPVRLALASSSSYRIIDAVIDKFGLRDRFELIYSAQEEPYGKPHPGVYISTAHKLCVTPESCLAIEDSINGVVSAKAAKMKCIAVPEATARSDRRYGIADVLLDSLNDIEEPMKEMITKAPS